MLEGEVVEIKLPYGAASLSMDVGLDHWNVLQLPQPLDQTPTAGPLIELVYATTCGEGQCGD